jgi:WD40 repeat protein
MSMRDFPTKGAALSTLDAACGVLMGGTFGGDYYLKSLDCDDKSRFAEGQITSDFSGITNHIKIYRPRRSSGPVAAIASNDCGFRIMDIGTEHFISEKMYPFALNCSALSPDHRLRVLVGDSSEAFITNADTGEVLQELAGHRDYGFACDWSDDGRTVATGFQDRGIKIWDARRWCNSSGVSTPLCTIRSEMASVRGLRFSPLGSGKPVLVAAEEADYINIIDAQTFASKQTIDVFGEIGGVSFANDGQDLDILSCDKHRGGLIQLERCGRRPEPLLDILGQQRSQRSRYLVEEEEAQFQDRWVRNREPTFHNKHLEPF